MLLNNRFIYLDSDKEIPAPNLAGIGEMYKRIRFGHKPEDKTVADLSKIEGMSQLNLPTGDAEIVPPDKIQSAQERAREEREALRARMLAEEEAKKERRRLAEEIPAEERLPAKPPKTARRRPKGRKKKEVTIEFGKVRNIRGPVGAREEWQEKIQPKTLQQAIKDGSVSRCADGKYIIANQDLYKWAYPESRDNWEVAPKYHHTLDGAIKSGHVVKYKNGLINLAKGYKYAYPKSKDNWYTIPDTTQKQPEISALSEKQKNQIKAYVSSSVNVEASEKRLEFSKRELLSEIEEFRAKGSKLGVFDDIDIMDIEYTEKNSWPRKAYSIYNTAYEKWKKRSAILEDNSMLNESEKRNAEAELRGLKNLKDKALDDLKLAVEVYFEVQNKMHKHLKEKFTKQLLAEALKYSLPDEYDLSSNSFYLDLNNTAYAPVIDKYKRQIPWDLVYKSVNRYDIPSFLKLYFKQVPSRIFRSSDELRDSNNVISEKKTELGAIFKNYSKLPPYQIINAMIYVNNIIRFNQSKYRLFANADNIYASNEYRRQLAKLKEQALALPLEEMLKRKMAGKDILNYSASS